LPALPIPSAPNGWRRWSEASRPPTWATSLEETDFALTAGDFARLTRRCVDLAPPGRCVLVLEGGYDDDALAASAGACVATLADVDYAPEDPSEGGPGLDVVADIAERRSRSKT
jgi:acetoin utilization deacetylase AcuC-like enzyme